MALPFIGFPTGEGVPVRDAAFTAELRSDLTRVTRGLEDLMSRKIDETAKIAIRQTLADIVAGVTSSNRPQFYVRSAVNDDSTCRICNALDGTVVMEGTEEYNDLAPPAVSGRADHHCEGGARCRCTYLALPAGASGWLLTAEVIDRLPESVAGELTLALDDDRRSMRHALKEAPEDLPRPHERRAAEQVSAAERADMVAGQRILREALTEGKPILARNILAGIEHLFRTGQVPPYAPGSDAGLEVLL